MFLDNDFSVSLFGNLTRGSVFVARFNWSFPRVVFAEHAQGKFACVAICLIDLATSCCG